MIWRPLRHNLPLVGSALLSVFAVAIFGFAVSWRQADQDRIDALARSTNQALCSFKLDLKNRAQQTELFIDEIRAGTREPIPGISIADLERSLGNQAATIESLSSLDCR